MTSGRALYCVLVDERVEKDLRGVPEYIFDKFVKILGELEIDPVNRRPGIDIKKLKGYSNIFRIRIGKYRIFFYDLFDKVIIGFHVHSKGFNH